MNPFLLAGLLFAGIGLLQLAKEEDIPLLPGPKGDAGKAGKTGATGKTGAQGAAGEAGKAPIEKPPNDG